MIKMASVPLPRPHLLCCSLCLCLCLCPTSSAAAQECSSKGCCKPADVHTGDGLGWLVHVVIMGRVLASAARTPSRDSIIQTTGCKNLPCTINHAVATISCPSATHCGLSWRFPLTDNTWPLLSLQTIF